MAIGDGHVQSRALRESLMATHPEVCHRNWRPAVLRAFLLYSRHEGWPRDFAEMVQEMRLEPDAYVVNKAERFVHFFEIEVYRPMKPEKLSTYAVLGQNFDYYKIEFAVFVVNQYGHINQVDLLPHYYEAVKRNSF